MRFPFSGRGPAGSGSVAIDYGKLRDFDRVRLEELDRRVDGDVRGELDGRKRNIEESRAKNRKKAAKRARKSTEQTGGRGGV